MIMKKLMNLAVALLFTGAAFAQDKKAVSATDFEKGIADKKAIVIDVRRPDEFKEGHIKGAINANWQNQEEFVAKTAKLDKSKPVYLYCLAGVRSDKAADYLIKSGFKQVVGLDGGIKAWNDAGKPVEKQ
jgi:rhodanese-related sulfurtransferase